MIDKVAVDIILEWSRFISSYPHRSLKPSQEIEQFLRSPRHHLVTLSSEERLHYEKAIEILRAQGK